MRLASRRFVFLTAFASVLAGCDDGATASEAPTFECVVSGPPPEFTQRVGCEADFFALASRPLNATIPGARSVKVMVDRGQDDALYFLNAAHHPRHFDFAAARLSTPPLPQVVDINLFNQTEYRSPDRRFFLGAVTWYEEPRVWAYEIAPYDAADADMVARTMALLAAHAFFGPELRFHPTSAGTEEMARGLPSDVKVVTTEDLFAATTYQPLKLGVAYGQLRFFSAAELDANYVGPRDVVVLDTVPNDITVVAGLITAEVQTPLSHVNVLAQNRGTPNMALRGAFRDATLRALEDQWVRLEVGAFDYTIEAVTRAEADAWWADHKPPPVTVPTLDLSVTQLTNIEDVQVDQVSAFGGKAANYAFLARIEGVPVPAAFVVPTFFYKQFEAQNGFDARLTALRAEPRFRDDPGYREAMLAEMRADMLVAPVDPDLEAALLQKLEAEFPNTRMRFRSSTNAEDLDGFTGAGLYDSFSGEPGDPRRPVLDAVRSTWASLWNFRAYEERDYRGIPHEAVAMAVLVHHSFRNEEANGVALTNNAFDPSQPACYVNVQLGEFSVVAPEPGVTVDAFLYFHDFPGQPVTWLSRSSLVGAGASVLTPAQIDELGRALAAIHHGFAPIYQHPGDLSGTGGPNFYAMDVEFKFDDLDAGGPPQLWVKQARPHPGRSGGAE